MKKLLLTLVFAGLLLAMTSCKGKVTSVYEFTPPGDAQRPQVTIEMENGGKIVIELYFENAPNTVCNFIDLAQSGFYDGLIFHRVGKNFMIQGGDPTANGGKALDYSITGEFSKNGFEKNTLTHKRGAISMARSDSMDSASSQFFICDGDPTYLDGSYAAFGMVVEGMDVVDEIASSPLSITYSYGGGMPAVDQVIKKVTVDTFGVVYPKPETIK